MELKGSAEYLHFMRLWDWYHPLLTKNKQEITNLYFNCDLSLSEIAEERGVSRQSVSDCLHGCRKQLEEYEEKLHFVRAMAEENLRLSCLMTDLGRKLEELSLNPAFSGQAAQLREILNHDYEEEVKRLVTENAQTLL